MVHSLSRTNPRFDCCVFLAGVSQVVFLVLTACNFSLAADSIPPQKPLNILFIVADDLRADVMSVYGGPVATPNLQRLADRGSIFFRATCGYPICHVSRSEMLTGRYLVSEASAGKSIPFDNSWKLLPQTLKEAGWHTVHSGKWHVAGTPTSCGYLETAGMYSPTTIPASDLSRSKSATNREVTGYVGWTFKDDQDQILTKWGVGLTPETDLHIADTVAETIRSHRSKPFFLHVNFTGPHDPLHWPPGSEHRFSPDQVSLPKNFREQHPFDHGNLHGRDELIVPAPRRPEDVRSERAVYYTIVQSLDAQVGKLMNAIEESPDPANWLIIFTSDQGLALGSHGLMGKQNQYEHTANTPLIIAGPKLLPGQKVQSQCALRDLYPTICQINGWPIPASVQGDRLLPILRGETKENREIVFGYFTDTQRMCRTSEGWKLVWYPKQNRIQLFHIPDDPDELNDLSTDARHELRRDDLLIRLKQWLTEQNDPVLGGLH